VQLTILGFDNHGIVYTASIFLSTRRNHPALTNGRVRPARHRRPSSAVLDTHCVDFALKRPDHVGDQSWAAIEAHRQRLELAAASSDAAWIIGSAKELVESVARVVADTKGYTIGSNADFGETATRAHKALERQPGQDVSMSPEVRSIATSAKSMVVNVNMIRNQVGTGHGRSSVPNVDEETIQVVVDAALLWVRWSLRRLEHMLIGEADLLIAELRGVSSRVKLQRHLDAVVLPDQPPEVAHALGVTFAQEAAGGTFIARMTGIEPCVASDDRLAWPESYRLGVVEGYVINRWGYITAAPQWVQYMIGVLPPVTPKVAIEGLDALISQVGTATWSPDDRQAVEDPYAAAGEMRRAAGELPDEVRPAWLRLADALDPVEQSD
jgi:hypothetical protein